ncbi:hypothetical protein McpSp1_11550 [Methanocorpusculaceae archaeon Sp1]|nr:hypothetical protein [Methanocorpusculaceae archaeon Sp1]
MQNDDPFFVENDLDGEENHVQSIYSWDIFSEAQASKHIDKSVLKYDGSGVPVELRDYFEVNSLSPGEKQSVILFYEGKEYSGVIEMENHNHPTRIPRTRIFWDKKFGDHIRAFCEADNDESEILFLKSASMKNHYYVKIIRSLPKSAEYLLTRPIPLPEIPKESTTMIDTEVQKSPIFASIDKNEVHELVIAEFQKGKLEAEKELKVEEIETEVKKTYDEPISDPPLPDMPDHISITVEEESNQVEALPAVLEDVQNEYDMEEKRCSEINDMTSKYSHKGYMSELKRYLMQLGFSNNEAVVCATLLFWDGPHTISVFISTGGSKDKIEDGLTCLSNKGIVSDYVDKNTRGRYVKYYSLAKKPIEIYEYLKEINSKIVSEMIDDFKTIDTLLDMELNGASPQKNECEDMLIKFGIQEGVVKIMLYLNEHPRSSQKDMENNLHFEIPRNLQAYLRELYRIGWIMTAENGRENKLTYTLSESLNDIVLRYISIQTDNIKDALDELLRFIQFKEKGVEEKLSDEQCNNDYISTLSSYDKRFGTHLRNNYNEIFYEAIQDSVISHTALDIMPLNLKLQPPHLENIRVYLYKVSKDRQSGFKSVLRVPGQIVGQRGNFNLTNTSFVILGGYYPEKDLFVLWDAYLHDNFGFNKNIQVKSEGLIEAEILGISTQKRTLNSGKIEYITIVATNNLLKGIKLHYDQYVDRLLNE